MGSAGGFSVGRELLRHIAIVRPDWTVSCVLISGHPLHEEMRHAPLPDNCQLLWAPGSTISRLKRTLYERRTLIAWVRSHKVDAVIQLNGMLVSGMGVPTLCHMQDPWPYRPEAWDRPGDRIVALMKRRRHRSALKNASQIGWTSAYLRNLICASHEKPNRGDVFYNGIPREWIERARTSIRSWKTRPNQIISVSDVTARKRQHLVVQALPSLIRRTGLEDLTYRIIGKVDSGYRRELELLARELGVAEHVRIDGRISERELIAAFESARCFVTMSICESFGIPAIEAMSFGTPVIVSNCCAMPEICGNAGELVPIDDVNALADRTAEILLNSRKAQELQQAGIDRIAAFCWEDTAGQMAGAVEEMVHLDQTQK